MSSYPDVTDRDFILKLYSKKEVKDLVEPLLTKNFKSCSFLHPHQDFLKLLINKVTPYQKLLLYHNTGSGKTFLLFGLIESNYACYRKKIVILTKNEHIKNDIKEKAKVWLQKKHVYESANKLNEDAEDFIDTYVHTQTMGILTNNITDAEKKNSLETLITEYSDRLIIIDEVHNLNTFFNEDGKTKKVSSDSILKLIKRLKNIKLIIMTASPFVDNTDELNTIIHLLTDEPIADTLDHLENAKKYLYRKVSYYNTPSETVENSNEKLVVRYFNAEEITLEVSYMGPYKIDNLDLRYTMLPMGDLQNLYYIYYLMKKVINKNSATTHDTFDRALLGLSLSILPLTSNLEYIKTKLKQALETETIDPEIDSLIVDITSISDNVSHTTHDNVDYRRQIFKLDIHQINNKDVDIHSLTDNLMYIIKDPKILSEISPKLYFVLDKINTLQKESYQTPIVIYFELVNKIGIYFITSILSAYGYHAYTTDSDRYAGKRYAIITGKTPEHVNNTMYEKFNSHENINGNVIKILLITNKLSEGISIYNVGTLFLLQTHWNFTRVQQLIGRFNRQNSHIRLPKERRNLQIFILCALSYDHNESPPPITQPLHDFYRKEQSIDYKQLQASENKYPKTLQILNIFKENAIDYEFFHRHNTNDPRVRYMRNVVNSTVTDTSTYILHTIHNLEFNFLDQVISHIVGTSPLLTLVTFLVENFTTTIADCEILLNINPRPILDHIIEHGIIHGKVCYKVQITNTDVKLCTSTFMRNMISTDYTGCTVSQLQIRSGVHRDILSPYVYYLTHNTVNLTPHQNSPTYLKIINDRLFTIKHPISTISYKNPRYLQYDSSDKNLSIESHTLDLLLDHLSDLEDTSFSNVKLTLTRYFMNNPISTTSYLALFFACVKVFCEANLNFNSLNLYVFHKNTLDLTQLYVCHILHYFKLSWFYNESDHQIVHYYYKVFTSEATYNHILVDIYSEKETNFYIFNIETGTVDLTQVKDNFYVDTFIDQYTNLPFNQNLIFIFSTIGKSIWRARTISSDTNDKRGQHRGQDLNTIASKKSKVVALLEQILNCYPEFDDAYFTKFNVRLTDHITDLNCSRSGTTCKVIIERLVIILLELGIYTVIS